MQQKTVELQSMSASHAELLARHQALHAQPTELIARHDAFLFDHTTLLQILRSRDEVGCGGGGRGGLGGVGGRGCGGGGSDDGCSSGSRGGDDRGGGGSDDGRIGGGRGGDAGTSSVGRDVDVHDGTTDHSTPVCSGSFGFMLITTGIPAIQDAPGYMQDLSIEDYFDHCDLSYGSTLLNELRSSCHTEEETCLDDVMNIASSSGQLSFYYYM